MGIIKFKHPDLKEVKDQNVIAAGLMVQLVGRAEQAELNLLMYQDEVTGKLDMADEAYRKLGKMIRMYKEIRKENASLKSQLTKKDKEIGKLKDFVSRLLFWKRKKKKQYRAELEKKYRSA